LRVARQGWDVAGRPDLVLVLCRIPEGLLAVALERREVARGLRAARREHARLHGDKPGRTGLRLVARPQRAIQRPGGQEPVVLTVQRHPDQDAGLLGQHHQLLGGQLLAPAAGRERVDQPARPGQRPFGSRPVLGELLGGGQAEQDVHAVLIDPAADADGVLLLLLFKLAAHAEHLAHVSEVGRRPRVVLGGQGIELGQQLAKHEARRHPVQRRALHRGRDAFMQVIEALPNAPVVLGRGNGGHLSRRASACP
jgi:hypothetical protein